MGTENLEETLLNLEERFWYGDSAFYEEYLTDEAVMVFPEPVGVLAKWETIASVAGSQRWADVRIEDSLITVLTDTVAMLTYHGTAVREGDEQPYNTLATSVYVDDDASWKLALHQQTPDTTDTGTER
ncbi:nuclear transport factor 2 family protein [Haladaptatus sp. DFWS20]|uniref:nuclear transport factor 2 family protein n=1 Tax=Haladaptatus sp. DFWS20 TaxID=3403467 RepID=UPI003EBB3E44